MTHQDYIDGYMDGYCLHAPEPNNNRSLKYRHSFRVGRSEKTGNPLTYDEIMESLKIAESEES